MKRSKVFLAVATSFLALASVAATKAHKFTPNSKVLIGASCLSYTTNCTNTGGITCKTRGSKVRTIFTLNSNCAATKKIHYATQPD